MGHWMTAPGLCVGPPECPACIEERGALDRASARLAAIAAAERRVIKAAEALSPEILAARDGDGWVIGQYAYGDVFTFFEMLDALRAAREAK